MADPTPQEIAATQVNARYKVYDSQLGKWVEYFFRTKVSQIGISGSKKLLTEHVTVNGQPFVLGAVSISNSDAVNEQASVTIDASHINWYNGDTRPSSNYLGSATKISEALQALDTAAKAAYDHVPSGILLSSENQDLVAIEALAGTSGLLKKTGTNTWSLDTTSYTPQSRKINNLDLSEDRELTGENINVSSLVNQSLATAIAGLQSSVAGFNKGYGISVSAVSGYVNDEFNSNEDYIRIHISANDDAPKLKVIGTQGQPLNQNVNSSTSYEVSFDDLKIGDTIYTTDTNKPDRWFAGRERITVDGATTGYYYYFYKLESTNLTNYWNSSNAYISADNNGAKTITMGSNSFTASSSNPTASWGSAVTVGNVGGVDLKFTMPSAPSYTDTKNTAGSTDTPSKIYLIGATSQAANPQTYSQDTAWVDTDGCVYSNGKRVANVVVADRTSSSSDTPSGFSNAKAGDIWIDTTSYN